MDEGCTTILRVNEIYQGDCLDIMKSIDDTSIDFIICDLPYAKTGIKWDKKLSLCDLWQQYKRIIKPYGVICLTAVQPFTSLLISSNLEMFKYEWIWVKSKPFNFLNAKNSPMSKHESVLVFSFAKVKHEGQKNRMPYFPQGLALYNKEVRGRKKDSIMGHKIYRKSFKEKYVRQYTNYPTSVLEINSVNNDIIHATQKPVALFEYMIKTYTREGDVVLDNCAGSGTTAIACLNCNRNFILIEKDPYYVEVIKNRLEQYKKNGGIEICKPKEKKNKIKKPLNLQIAFNFEDGA